MVEPETMSFYKERGTRGFENYYTLNIVSHTTMFVKGSFTVTDVNQHLFFIKLTGSHSWGTMWRTDSHLQIDLSKLWHCRLGRNGKIVSTLSYLQVIFFF